MIDKNLEKRLRAADPVKKIEIQESVLHNASEATGKAGISKKFRMPNLKLSLAVLAGATAILVALPILNLSNTVSPLISLGESGQQAPADSRAENGMLSPPEDAIGGKMIMPNPFTYIYEAGSDLSDATSEERVYKLVLAGSAKSVLNRVSEAFGVSGEVFEPEYSTPDYPTYLVGSKDGTAKSVNVTWTGTGNWWFNDPDAYPASVCLEFEQAEDGSEYCARYEEQKPTPELQPSKAEMVSQAVKIFAATGLMVSASDIYTNSNEWGSSAFASLQINGQDSPIEWSLYWAANGILASASGHSVILLDKGNFPTISERDAVKRISDWRYSGAVAQSLWAKYQSNSPVPEIAYDSPLVRDGESSNGESSNGEPTPRTITVTITKSVKTPMMIWDSTGAVWLVPGYLLIGDQGWLSPVFSLADGIVTLPAPVEITPFAE